MEDKYKGRYKYKNTWDYEPKRYDAIRDVYKNQLRKFEKLGLGNYTEYGVKVTPELIRITQKRYDEVKKLTFKYSKKMVTEAEKSVMSQTFIDELTVVEEEIQNEGK